jgi:hypothetical protein
MNRSRSCDTAKLLYLLKLEELTFQRAKNESRATNGRLKPQHVWLISWYHTHTHTLTYHIGERVKRTTKGDRLTPLTSIQYPSNKQTQEEITCAKQKHKGKRIKRIRLEQFGKTIQVKLCKSFWKRFYCRTTNNIIRQSIPDIDNAVMK